MSVRAGSGVAAETVWTPEPGMLKAIVSAPGRALACSIAARRVQTPPAVAQTPSLVSASPASPVSLTVKVAAERADARSPPKIASSALPDLGVCEVDHTAPRSAMIQSDQGVSPTGQFSEGSRRVEEGQSYKDRMAFIARFRSWRLFQKSPQGSFFLSLASKLPRLKSEGLSVGRTSVQSSGVETGAPGAWRTQKGETTVWAKPLRKGSR